MSKRSWMLSAAHLMVTLALPAVAGVASAVAADAPQPLPYTFVVVDIPDPNARLGLTTLSDINEMRQLLANLTTGPRGFLIDRFELTEIECPSGAPTAARSINKDGDITGFCGGAGNPTVGYLRGDDGVFQLLSVPGATLTEAVGINDSVQIVGDYRDSAGKFHGFFWDDGAVLTIDVPFSDAVSTAPSGVNNLGHIVGFYLDASFNAHGFLDDGVFTTLNFPGANATEPVHINDLGQIVGSYADKSGILHGFVLDHGAFTSIDAPFPGVSSTEVNGINNHGQIVGRFVDSAHVSRGFIATPITGSSTDAQPTVIVTGGSQLTSQAPLNQPPMNQPSTIGRLPRASWVNP